MTNTGDYNFALMLSSYRRPLECIRQGLTMLNQTYQNFTLFIAVKGVSKRTFEIIIKPQFEQHIKTGKVVLTYHPNKNQLSNLLDTIRNQDIEKFDCFCKIDDDDIYAPDYLEQVNNFNKTYNVTCSFFQVPGQYINYNINDLLSQIVYYNYYCFGPTEVLGLNEIKWLQQYELGNVNIKDYADDNDIIRFNDNIGHIEDALIDRIIKKTNKIHCNRAEYVLANSNYSHCIITRGTKSISNRQSVSNIFYKTNKSSKNMLNDAVYEHTIEIEYNGCRILTYLQTGVSINFVVINERQKELLKNLILDSFIPERKLILKHKETQQKLEFYYNNFCYSYR